MRNSWLSCGRNRSLIAPCPAFLELVQRSKQPDRQIQMQGILLTLPEGEPLGGRWECELRGRFGPRVLPQVVPFDDEVGKALEVGQIVSRFNPQSLAAQQYQALAEHLSLTREAALVGSLSESPLAALSNSYQAELSSLSSHAMPDRHEPTTATAVVDVDSVLAAEPLKAPNPHHGFSEETLHGEEQFLPLAEEPNEESFAIPELDLPADEASKVEVDLEEPELLPEPVPAPPVSPSHRLRSRQAAPRPAPRATTKEPEPVSTPALVPHKETRGLLTSPHASIFWIGGAMAGGIAMRFVQLPDFMLPIVVGIVVAATVVLVLRLLGAGDPPVLPPQPVSHPQPRPEVRVPQPVSRKDPTSRLDQFAGRANRRRNESS